MSFFQKSKRFPNKVLNQPGVGQYNMQKWNNTSYSRKSRSVVIGRSKRSTEIKQSSPGPGQYQIHNSNNSPRSPHVKILGKSTDEKIEDFPGPGKYHIENQTKVKYKNEPSFTFSSAKLTDKHKEKFLFPGPGQYDNPNLISKTGPLISFGKSKKNQKVIQNLPGPADYKFQIGSKSNGYIFGEQKKFKTQQQILRLKKALPAPTDYQIYIKRTIKGGRFSKSRIRQNYLTQNPGPGSYTTNLQPIMRQSPKAVIGLQKILQNKQKLPGPGQYNLTSLQKYKKKSSSYIFSKSRKNDRILTESPGPGYYLLENSLLSKKGSTISPRKSSQKINLNPSPQHYEPQYQKLLNKQPKYTIGRQKKFKQINKSKEFIGPGHYFRQQLQNWKGFSFSKQVKKIEKKLSPGPGDYQIKSKIGQIPSYFRNSINQLKSLN